MDDLTPARKRVADIKSLLEEIDPSTDQYAETLLQLSDALVDMKRERAIEKGVDFE